MFCHEQNLIYVECKKIRDGKRIMDNVLDQLLESSYQKYLLHQTTDVKSFETMKSIFDIFLAKCIEYHNGTAHSLSELKEKCSTKSKGDLFELFCARYLKSIKGYEKVWLISNIVHKIAQINHLSI